MKHRIIASILLLATLTTPSCIGSFSLTNRMLNWNRNIDNKFINELVFFAFWVLPVYEVCGLADILVLNSIEFWSGNNPVDVAAADRVVEGSDGKYIVRPDATGYDIVSMTDGSVMRLDFNAAEQSWNLRIGDDRTMLFAFVDDSHIKLPAQGGRYTVVETSQAGALAYKQMMLESCLAAR